MIFQNIFLPMDDIRGNGDEYDEDICSQAVVGLLWARMKLKERVTIGIVASLTGDHHCVDGGIA